MIPLLYALTLFLGAHVMSVGYVIRSLCKSNNHHAVLTVLIVNGMILSATGLVAFGVAFALLARG